MLNLMRFLRVPSVICIGVLGCLNTAPAFACTSDEITLSNGNCVPAQFSMTVGGFPSDGDDFTFYVAAVGTLYIDWGDGYIETKTLSNNNLNQRMAMTRKFYDTQDAYTIRLSGNFSAYPKKNTSYSNAVFSLYGGYGTPEYLYGISGSLGALFPTLDSSANSGNSSNQPMFWGTFRGATNLKGPIPANLFTGISGTATKYMFREMFYDCTNLDGYIPYNLFDGITGLSSSHMQDIFKNDTKLATTCPTGTTQYTTGYENYWKPGTSGANATPRVACKPDAVACDHPYNGECPDLCPFASELRASNGASIPLFAERVTTHTLCVKKDNTTCYIPLENGIGGTGSLNVKNGNDIYHAGQIDTL